MRLKKGSPDVNPPAEQPDNERVVIYSQQIESGGTGYSVYLPDTLQSTRTGYVELMRLLDTASDTDQVTFNLAHSGGDSVLGIELCYAIMNSSATTLSRVTAPCYSIGSMIALSSDVVRMAPHTFLMFHGYSGTFTGKSSALLKEVEAYNTHFWGSFRRICMPFLTNKEVELLYRDDDLYVKWNDPGLSARIARHYKSRGV